MPRWPRHSCVATGTGAPGGRGAWGGGRPRTQAPADRARRTHRDDRASDGRCQGTRDNRSTMLLVAVSRQVSSFRLLTLSCRYGMLFGSDCTSNTLRDVIEVKRGDTVGVSLGVTCAVVYTYGCDDGRIAPTRCAIIAAGLDGR